MDRKILPVGLDSFEKIRRNGFYYIDKTRLIKEVLTNRGDVNLFTRPHRFGKRMLHAHYGEQVILLIDEYDVPLDKAHINGYYDQMVAFLRGFFGSARNAYGNVLLPFKAIRSKQ